MSGNRADLRGAVRAFAGRVHAPEGGRHHVASPLGAWLLIALAAQAMEGAEREAATAALGMDPMVAAEAAAALLTQVPEAVRAAVAVWHRGGLGSEAFEVWQAGLPGAVETGEIPTQPAADAWADRCTDHRVRAFPLPLTEDSALVLASALATRVRWFTPLFSVPATELGPSSPWSRSIKWALAGSDRCAIVRTSPAGLVGVHVKLAAGLVVVSVIAGPEVDALTVLDCAYAIAVDVATDALHSVSLFDLPLGDGVAWTITEMEIPSDRPGERAEQTEGVLPAWSATSDLALSAPGGAFDGFADGLSVLLRPDARGYFGVARQLATAQYTREGFDAAAVIAWDTLLGAALPHERALLRSATLRFGHPFAVVAAAAAGPLRTPDATASPAQWHALPVFSAWVTEPDDSAPPEPNRRLPL